MKNLLLLLFGVLFSYTLQSQNMAFGYNYILGKPTIYLTNSPGNQVGNRYELATAVDSADFYFRSAKFRLRSLRWDATPITSLKNIVSVDDSGWLYRGNIYSILDTSATMSTRSWATTSFMPITATTTQVSEGTNQYYTQARSRAAISAGTGMSYNSSTGIITNSAPDQTVVLTGGTGITTGGTYPNLTVTNSAPDRTVVLMAGTGITTGGTYPNFTVTNSLPDQTVSLTAGTGISTSGTYPNFTVSNTGVTSIGLSSSDFSVSGSPVTTSGTITANLNTSGVSAGTYERVTVNTKGIVTAGSNPTWADVTRPINSSTYTISSTQVSAVMYYITIACTATIGGPSAGSVLFQWSTNGGSTWNDGGIVANSNTVTLAVVLNSINSQTSCLSWDGIPANALCRLVPTSSGTTTITWVRGREKTY